MFQNVLAGVDGRPNGRDAIALASRLTDPAGKLTLAHVHGGALRPSYVITPGRVDEERKACEELLERERADAQVAAALLSIEGYTPGAALHQQAEARDADLLVVGSCRHGVFGRAMLGDDTRAALNGAPCAVAVAPLGYAQHPAAITRIGVAYNGSLESVSALALARELAATTGATIQALEVAAIPTLSYTGLAPAAIGQSIDTMLQQATSRMKELPDTEGRAVYGLPGEELAGFSGEVDLLIVGSRGYGPIKRLVLGSTSNYLARHARCPLLVLPRIEAGQSADSESSEIRDVATACTAA